MDYEGPGGWRLTRHAAAVHPEARTAVIADVHLGYEWARGRGGDCVPAHSLDETIGRLNALCADHAIQCLVVAGDLVESPRFCRRTEADVAELSRWLLDRGVRLVALAGNHDRPRRTAQPESLEVAGWTIAHGHRRVAATRTITGHLHPVIRANGLTAPCFLVDTTTIVLPAFSANAAGVPVETLGRRCRNMRCVAIAGDEVLDFGPVSSLLRALRV